jgi:hypothetical protein
MRFLGALLVLIGAFWIMACFVGTAMMSRGVDMFTEAVLPSAIGFALMLIGVWLFSRARKAGPPT